MTNIAALFQSVNEHPDPVTVDIHGEIPEWLRGTYFTVGNGLYDLPSGFTMNNALDGYAILYSYRLTGDGKQLVVRSRYLESDAYKKAIAKGKPVAPEFGTRGSPDPEKGAFTRVLSKMVPINLTDNGCVNITTLQGGLYAISETSLIHEIDRETLHSIKKVDLFKTLGFAFISGSPICLEEGDTYLLCHSVGTALKSHVVQFPPTTTFTKDTIPVETKEISDKTAKTLATVSSRWKFCFSYMHSFGMTSRYFLLVDQPLLVNSLKVLMSQIQQKTMRDTFSWQPKEEMLFMLINRTTSEVTKLKFTARPVVVFDIINMYEDENHVIVDLLGRQTDIILEKLQLKNLRQNQFSPEDPPQSYRYVLPIMDNLSEIPKNENLVTISGTKATAELQNDSIFCTPEAIVEPGFDYPAINMRFRGKKYRYIYGTGFLEEGFYHRAICKVDLLTKNTQLIRVENHQYLTQPIFVSRPDATEEDDGVVLTIIVDTRPDCPSTILFVDGKTFLEVGRAEIPYQLAYLQRGMFFMS